MSAIPSFPDDQVQSLSSEPSAANREPGASSIPALFFNRQPIPDIAAAVSSYDPSEFASPTRSTIAMLSLLYDGGAVWVSILEELGMSQPAELHLEYQTEVQAGRGKPSHTDVMVIASDAAISMEAKWTEPRYEDVASWLGKGSENRHAVLGGWLSLLQRHACTQLDARDFSDVVYQMVHRAASACMFARPTLAYLLFSPLPDGNPSGAATIRGDLEHLHSLLGSPESFPFWLIEVPLKPTESFAAIHGLPKGSAHTAAAVRSAMVSPALFEFSDAKIERVGRTGAS